MKQHRVTYRLIPFLLILMILSGILMAQEDRAKEEGTLEILKALTERSQSQQMLDLMIGQSQNRFLDDYVNPDEYIVGPGDGFVIYFLSSGITNINCQINSDSRLFVKSVGAIQIGHVSLARAIDLVRQAVSEKYNRSEFTVQLNSFRFSKVNVLGEVKTPGIYYVPATWRISEVISLAGGLTEQASIRRITLSGFGNDIKVDLVRYYSMAETGANPMICRGNTIMIPSTGRSIERVTISGEVVKASSYEYMAGDKIEDYILFSGGLKGRKEDLRISIYAHDFKNEAGQRSVDINWSDLPEYLLQAGENINICLKDDLKRQTEVMIFGAVHRPGRYSLKESERSLEHLFKRSGGITDNGSKAAIQIFRMTSSMLHNLSDDLSTNREMTGFDRTPTHQLMSLNPRQPHDFSKLSLNEGDSIFVPKVTGMVTVIGAVAYPGLVSYRPDQKFDYYIRAAGGYASDADQGRVIVINNYSAGNLDAKAAGPMLDGETVMVPRKETSSKR